MREKLGVPKGQMDRLQIDISLKCQICHMFAFQCAIVLKSTSWGVKAVRK